MGKKGEILQKKAPAPFRAGIWGQPRVLGGPGFVSRPLPPDSPSPRWENPKFPAAPKLQGQRGHGESGEVGTLFWGKKGLLGTLFFWEKGVVGAPFLCGKGEKGDVGPLF